MQSIVGQKEVMGAIVTYKYLIPVLRSGASTEGEQRRDPVFLLMITRCIVIHVKRTNGTQLISPFAGLESNTYGNTGFDFFPGVHIALSRHCVAQSRRNR